MEPVRTPRPEPGGERVAMRAMRFYIDTSVIGGRLDPEFRADTLRLFDRLAEGEAQAVISDLVLAELVDAPASVRQFVVTPSAVRWELVRESEEALSLAQEYLCAGVVGLRFRDDCRHVAMATLADVDALLSWNFRHIVQLDKIRAFNAVNLRLGYHLLEIRSPSEVAYYG